jgi:hypothetical protein
VVMVERRLPSENNSAGLLNEPEFRAVSQWEREAIGELDQAGYLLPMYVCNWSIV